MTVLITLLIFFLPLIVLPVGISLFETPKVIAAEILIEALLFLALLKNRLNLKTFVTPASLGFSLLLFLTIIHLIFLKTGTTFFGNPFRLQGVFLLWHLMILALISSQINLPKKAYLFSAVSLGVLLLSAFILGGDLNGRAFGTLGEANSLAAAAVFLLPFGLLKTSRWVKCCFLLVVALIILASGSRAGAIALSVQLIFLGAYFILKLKLTWAFLISLLISFSSSALPVVVGGGWYENRSEIWYTALVTGTFSPIVGHGFGNTEEAIHKTSLILNNNIQYQVIDSSHNIFLDFWIQGGFLGILGLCTLIIFTVRKFLAHNQILHLTIILGLFTALSFNPVSVSILIFFWWTLGQGMRKDYN